MPDEKGDVPLENVPLPSEAEVTRRWYYERHGVDETLVERVHRPYELEGFDVVTPQPTKDDDKK